MINASCRSWFCSFITSTYLVDVSVVGLNPILVNLIFGLDLKGSVFFDRDENVYWVYCTCLCTVPTTYGQLITGRACWHSEKLSRDQDLQHTAASVHYITNHIMERSWYNLCFKNLVAWHSNHCQVYFQQLGGGLDHVILHVTTHSSTYQCVQPPALWSIHARPSTPGSLKWGDVSSCSNHVQI